MIFGAILAGGKGTRMGIDKPKQFLMLGNKPIIIHTIEKFLVCDRIDKVFVGVHPDWVDYTEDLIGRYIHTDKALSIVPGGKDRNGTIFNIVDQIESEYGENDSHIIVTHDSVRPFVTHRIIEENVKYAKEFGATDTVIPATDTIVTSTDHQCITEIPDRSLMYQGQTPQSFHAKKLRELYEGLTREEKEILTDACKILVLKGEKVHLVEGEVFNIKITYPYDIRVAKSILGGGQTC